MCGSKGRQKKQLWRGISLVMIMAMLATCIHADKLIAYADSYQADENMEPSPVTESGVDVVTESGADVVTESGVDVVTESGVDVVTESGVDVVTDSGVNVITKLGVDVVTGSGADAVTGSGLDDVEDLTINSNYTLTENMVVNNLTITGGTVKLNGYELEVLGELEQTGGTLDIGKGKLWCRGNYIGSGRSDLYMLYADGHVCVEGEFSWKTSVFSRLQSGTIELKGNLTNQMVENGDNNPNFYFFPDMKLVLSGINPQHIAIDPSSRYGGSNTMSNLTITNKSGVVFDTIVYVKGLVNVNGCPITGQELGICSNTTFINNTYTGDIVLSSSNVTLSHVEGDVRCTGSATLSNSLTIDGVLTIDSGYMDLNESNLTVTKDVIIKNGELRLNGGTLSCMGDMELADGYSYLSMTEPDDYVLVYGDLNVNSNASSDDYLTNGTLELKGNFTQTCSESTYNFQAKNLHKVIFSGESLQTISFQNNENYFNQVEIKNTSEEGVCAPNGMIYTSLELNGNKLTLPSDSKHQYGRVLAQDEVYEGDFYLIAGELDLNGHQLKIKGNLIQSAGSIQLNGGTLVVEGDYRIQTEYEEEDEYGENEDGISYTASMGSLIMSNPKDKVLVHGSFIMQPRSGYQDSFTNGTLEVKKDFIAYEAWGSSNRYFQTTGAHKVVLSGEEYQEVVIPNGVLANLEVTNSSEEGVKLSSCLCITGRISDPAGKITGTIDLASTTIFDEDKFSGSIRIQNDIGTYHLPVIAGDLSISVDYVLDEDVSIGGKLYVSQKTIDLNGKKLTVNGDIELYSAVMKFNGGRCICKGNLQTTGYYSAGYLSMDNTNDYICIYGYFDWRPFKNIHEGVGTIELKGNLSQSYYTSDTNELVHIGNKLCLSGDEEQWITMPLKNCYFDEIEITNQSEAGVYCSTPVMCKKLITNGNNYRFRDQKFTEWTLTKDEVYTGNLNMLGGEINLNGHTLEITGNLVQAGGTINVNQGTLKVNGSYQIEDSAQYSEDNKTSWGKLVMNHSTDRVVVGADFVMGSCFNHNEYLTDGQMEVHGNFLVKKNCTNGETFQTTKNFWLVMNSDKAQTLGQKDPLTEGKIIIANLEFINTHTSGVTLQGNVSVTGTVKTNGSNVNGSIYAQTTTVFGDDSFSGSVVFSTPFSIKQETNVKGDVTLDGSTDSDGSYLLNNDLTVGGKLTICNTKVMLNGYTITAGKGAEIKDSIVELQGGRILCKGDMTLGTADASLGHCIVMEDAEDYVLVEGTLYYNLKNAETMKQGTLELKGDFIQGIAFENQSFQPQLTTILSGESLQNIIFIDNESKFNRLIIKNTSSEGIYFDAYSIPANSFENDGCKIRCRYQGKAGWILQEDTTLDDYLYIDSGELDLNGHTLTVNDNLCIGAGDLFLNGGHLNVTGDLRLQSEGGVKGFVEGTGTIKMDNPKDYICVDGDFIVQSSVRSDDMIEGTIELKGNFKDLSSEKVFVPQRNHTVLFSGTKRQNIELSKNQYTFFNNLKITNSGEGVAYNNNFYVEKVLSDPNKKIIPNGQYSMMIDYLSYIEGGVTGGDIWYRNTQPFYRDLDIGGKLTAEKKLDLNGHSLSAKSIYAYDEIYLNGGSINLTGNFETTYYGFLTMDNANDYVCIGGDFNLYTMYGGSKNYWSAGTIEVQGNVQIYNTINASDTHKIILSGKSTPDGGDFIQDIKLYSSTCFNELVLTKPIEKNYTFSRDVNDICKNLICDENYIEAPTKVNNLVMKEVGAATVSLAWDESTDDDVVMGYLIYRDHKKVGTTSSTEYIDDALQPDTEYVYEVYAFDRLRHCSEVSDPLAVTTTSDITAPSQPKNVKIQSRTGSSITISWSCSTDDVKVTGYKIYRNGEFLVTLGDVYTYKDTAVKEKISYTYTVKAIDAAGNSSALSAGVTSALQMPKITKMLPADHGIVGGVSTRLTLYYENKDNSIGNTIKFQYSLDGQEWHDINNSVYGQYRWDDTTLYSYCNWDLSEISTGECKIRATLYDADKNQDTLEAVYQIDKDGPEAPTNLTAVNRDGTVELSWLPSVSSDCQSYELYRFSSAESWKKIETLSGASAVTYVDRAVVFDQKYWYKVVAIDCFGQAGEPSALAAITVKEDYESPTVTSIYPVETRVNKLTYITVYASDNKQLANISLSMKNGDTWVEIGSKAADSYASFTWDTTAYPDGEYEIKAIATDTSDNVSEDYVQKITIDNTGIAQIEITEVSSTSDYVKLKWKNVEEDDFGCFVVEQLVDNEYVQVARSTDTLGAYIKNLNADCSYKFRVVGYDNLGNRGIPSQEVYVVTTSDTTAPAITGFYPLNKFYATSIPIKIIAKDNNGVSSLCLKYSMDGNAWNDLTMLHASEEATTVTFDYNFDISGLPEGEVIVQAIAYDIAGNESSANGAYICNNFFVDRTAPDAITDLKVEAKNGYIALNWSAPKATDVKGFDIYRAPKTTGTYGLIKSNITSLNYYDTAVNYDTKYKYKIVVNDQAGNRSEFSNEVISEAQLDTEVPIVHGVSPKQGEKIGSNQAITALVSDNVKVASVTMEYKPKNSADDTWSSIATIDVNTASDYVKATWDNSQLDSGEYLIRISVTDAQGNGSKPYQVSYMLDTTAPESVKLTGTGKGYRASLSWSECKAKDFAGYAIYEKVDDDNYSFVKDVAATEYVINNLTPGKEYTYVIYTYDESGNYSISNEVTITPTDVDDEAPVAVLSSNYSAREGCEIFFDGSGSYDNLKVVKWEWNFGNGDTAQGASVKYKYPAVGTYKATLTVTDAAGNQSSAESNITIYDLNTAQVTMIITNSYSNGLANAYICLEKDGVQMNYRADSKGNFVVALDAGSYKVSTYKEGYLPKETTLTVKPGGDQTIQVVLSTGALVTGTLTTRKLDVKELEDLGVDISDPVNWYTYTYEIIYTSEKEPQPKKYSFSLSEGKTTRVSIDGDSYSYTIQDIQGRKVVVRYHTVSYLKRMFEVQLTLTNNAEEQFYINDGFASLFLPKGMSLLDVSEPQSITTSVADLYGQKSTTINWYVKADEPGTYNLSAGYTGKLQPFDANVYVTIESAEPLVVTNDDFEGTSTDNDNEDMVDYRIFIRDQQGNAVQGALAEISYLDEFSRAVSNSDGAVFLRVNKSLDVKFTLTITCDGYLDYINRDYQTNWYQGDEVKITSKELEPYEELLPGYEGDFKLKYVSMDGVDIRGKKRTYNLCTKDSLRISAVFNEEITSFTVNATSFKDGTTKELYSSEINATMVNIFNISTEKMEAGDVLSLIVTDKKTNTKHEYRLSNISFKYEELGYNLQYYHQELAEQCALYAALAYRNEIYYREYWDLLSFKDGINLDQKLVKDGFILDDKYLYVNYGNKNENDVSYTIARKKEGFTNYVYVIVRGTDSVEWYGNMYLTGNAYDASLTDHYSFSSGSKVLVDGLISYLRDYGIKDAKVIFTGHSRGAATSNLAAHYVTDHMEEINEKIDGYPGSSIASVGAYCYATPNCSQDAAKNKSNYRNIYNFCYDDDFVPQVPLKVWGYDKYGITFNVNSEVLYETNARYGTERVAIKGRVPSYNTDGTVGLITHMSKHCPSVKDFYEKKFIVAQHLTDFSDFMYQAENVICFPIISGVLQQPVFERTKIQMALTLFQFMHDGMAGAIDSQPMGITLMVLCAVDGGILQKVAWFFLNGSDKLIFNSYIFDTHHADNYYAGVVNGGFPLTSFFEEGNDRALASSASIISYSPRVLQKPVETAPMLNSSTMTYDKDEVATMKTFLNSTVAESTGVATEEKTIAQILGWDSDDVETWSGITFENGHITGIDLSYNYQIKGTLDCTGFSFLRTLDCTYCSLDKIILTGCSALTSLKISMNELKELNVTDCTQLTTLLATNNKLKSMDLSGCPNLETIEVGYNELETLTFGAHASVKKLKCSGNFLDIISESNLVSTIEDLKAAGIYVAYEDQKSISSATYNTENVDTIKKLLNTDNNASLLEWNADDISTWKNVCWNTINHVNYITEIDIQNKNLTGELDLTGLKYVRRFDCSGNQFTKLDVSGCSILSSLDCNSCQLTELNIENTPKLSDLTCSKNYLDLEQLQSSISEVSSRENSSVYTLNQMIPASKDAFCTKEYELLMAFASTGNNQQRLEWNLDAPGTWNGITWKKINDIYYVSGIDFLGYNVEGELDLSAFSALVNIRMTGCSISKIILPESMIEIKPDAFMNCLLLKNIVLSNHITVISERGMKGCESLEEITLPAVQTIKDYAFEGCTSLKRVTMISTCIYSDHAFDNCSNMEEPIKVTPEPTKAPEPTGAAKPTVTPEPTKAPEPTVTVKPTITPEPTVTPEPTETVKTTVTPKPTKTPEPTGTARPTETPEPTKAPEPTGTPGDSDVPVIPVIPGNPFPVVIPGASVTPEPSVTVKPTQVPQRGTLECRPILKVTYTGKAATPEVSVYDKEKKLTLDEDYSLTYRNNTKPGKAKVIIKGLGDYEGIVCTSSFIIVPSKPGAIQTASNGKIKWEKQTGVTGYVVFQYNKAKKKYVKTADVTKNYVTLSKLAPGESFKFKLRAYVIIDGKRVYSNSSKAVSLITNPKGTKILTYRVEKKQLGLAWQKVNKVSGYDISYSTSKNGNFKTVTVKSDEKTSIILKNLMNEKVYYVKIRTYIIVNKKKYYSPYTAVKQIKM